MQQDEKQIGVIIPEEKLSATALQTLIEEFILREGTDYGQREYSLDQKKEQVLRQLQSKKILILFDTKLETTTLVTREALKKMSRNDFEIVNAPEVL